MEIGSLAVSGEIGNLNEKIIEKLSVWGEFPEKVRVINRLITLNNETNLLYATVLWELKD
mgnify:CR=1 FL=1